VSEASAVDGLSQRPPVRRQASIFRLPLDWPKLSPQSLRMPTLWIFRVRSMRSCVRFPLNDVKIGPGFWGTRVAINRSACLPAVYEEERENGRLLNFERLHGTDPVSLSADLHSLRHGADSEIYSGLKGRVGPWPCRPHRTPRAAWSALRRTGTVRPRRIDPDQLGQHEAGSRGIRDPLVRCRC